MAEGVVEGLRAGGGDTSRTESLSSSSCGPLIGSFMPLLGLSALLLS